MGHFGWARLVQWWWESLPHGDVAVLGAVSAACPCVVGYPCLFQRFRAALMLPPLQYLKELVSVEEAGALLCLKHFVQQLWSCKHRQGGIEEPQNTFKSWNMVRRSPCSHLLSRLNKSSSRPFTVLGSLLWTSPACPIVVSFC